MSAVKLDIATEVAIAVPGYMRGVASDLRRAADLVDEQARTYRRDLDDEYDWLGEWRGRRG